MQENTTINDPLWYKDAVIYQLHVKTFYDSDGDGIGDFRGLTQKLDHLQELGVTALWLLPFYPSPLRDDGYDIADFRGINPSYGTMRDFRALLREAHRRGLRVITELVINHTSDQHAWFQRARHARPGSVYRDFYVWADDPKRYADARIIFQDFESSNWSWDPVAGAYYWHRFYSHQPDLNFENPRVHEEVFKVLDHWMAMGVDGLRLDAVPYLYEADGTSCENLPATHDFLKKLRTQVEQKHPGRMLLAEANQWPEDAVAYFGEGDECHMCFHFPLMPRLYMALEMENRFPVTDIQQQTPEIPESCQWAIFLRNHDELTLEMVTDEERDYMYRAYAHDRRMRINLGIRRRLSPLLRGDRRAIELMNALLMSLPGTPVIYYGDEIGMGDNVFLGDRNGVRTPMQWTSDRNAGFSRANPHELYLPVIIDPEYHYEVFNAETQRNNRASLLWWMRRLITVRSQIRAFSRGSLKFLEPDNPRVLVFLREYEEEQILVVVNLSRFNQYVELDLEEYKDKVPTDVFGANVFPVIGEQPYFLSLAPHTFYWFRLESRFERDSVTAPPERSELPALSIGTRWDEVLKGARKKSLERILAAYLPTQRWFGSKGLRIKTARISETIPLTRYGSAAHIVFVSAEYDDGGAETYILPMAAVDHDEGEPLLDRYPRAAIARISGPGDTEGYLVDGLIREDVTAALLVLLARRTRVGSGAGQLVSTPGRAIRALARDSGLSFETRVAAVEQSNSSVFYGDRFMLKFFRRLQEGVNPDLEIGRFLTDHRFDGTPGVAGSLEYEDGDGRANTLAILQDYVANQGDAWSYTLDNVHEFFDRVWATDGDAPPALPSGSLCDLAATEAPEEHTSLVGVYIDAVRILAERTAEMHTALASANTEPEFVAEPLTALYQRSLYQSIRSLTVKTFGLFQRRLRTLPERHQEAAEALIGRRDEILERLKALIGTRIAGARIRCHGDYHLGQVLFTGRDFVIIDFEGEPARPISERRIKRSPLRDVAGMLRSFHYAAHSALGDEERRGSLREEDRPTMETWAAHWYVTVSREFLRHYLAADAASGVLPADPGQLGVLLDAFLLEKAVYELGYEINNRPGWVSIPLEGIRQLLGG